MSRGNLYYARLKTDVGFLYKFGFTTLESVERRLAFQGTGDERLLDQVMMFQAFDQASQIEEAVHRKHGAHSAFGHRSNDPRMPLCGNGQSELYVCDILGFDSSYTEAQGNSARLQIAQHMYNTSWSPGAHLAQPTDSPAARRAAADVSRAVSAFQRLTGGLARFLQSDQERSDAALLSLLPTFDEIQTEMLVEAALKRRAKREELRRSTKAASSQG